MSISFFLLHRHRTLWTYYLLSWLKPILLKLFMGKIFMIELGVLNNQDPSLNITSTPFNGTIFLLWQIVVCIFIGRSIGMDILMYLFPNAVVAALYQAKKNSKQLANVQSMSEKWADRFQKYTSSMYLVKIQERTC